MSKPFIIIQKRSFTTRADCLINLARFFIFTANVYVHKELSALMSFATKFLACHLLQWVCQFLFLYCLFAFCARQQGQKAGNPGGKWSGGTTWKFIRSSIIEGIFHLLTFSSNERKNLDLSVSSVPYFKIFYNFRIKGLHWLSFLTLECSSIVWMTRSRRSAKGFRHVVGIQV